VLNCVRYLIKRTIVFSGEKNACMVAALVETLLGIISDLPVQAQ